jgi:hypothetical protein
MWRIISELRFGSLNAVNGQDGEPTAVQAGSVS